MSFQGINFANQRLVPSDDGRLYQAIFTDGALFGCAASYNGSSFTIQPGYLIAGGRLFEIDAAESLVVNGAISGFAQIVIAIDLTKTATKEAFNQISFDTRYASSESGFATLIQDDINGAGSRYELQLAMMSLGTGGITGIVQDVPVAALKGGGTSLNYKVVGGTTQPASVVENTLWVNTNIKITSHAFSATQPLSPATGDVWFMVGTSCAAPFNALKKDDVLMVYPVGCKQYNNGKWIDKTAKTYQGNQWIDWRTYFFESGKGAIVPFFVSSYFPDPIEGVVGNSFIQILSTYNNGGERGLSTEGAHDLTNFKTIYFDVLAGTSNFTVGVATEVIYFSTELTAYKAVSANSSRQIVAVDVSKLTGAYYIGGNNGRDATTDEKIYNIYAE